MIYLQVPGTSARFHSLMDAGKKRLLVDSHLDVWLMVRISWFTSISWFCGKYHTANYSNNMFHSYNIELNNSYSVLADLNDTSVLTLGSLNSSLHPPTASSPKSTRGYSGTQSSVRTNSTTRNHTSSVIGPAAR